MTFEDFEDFDDSEDSDVDFDDADFGLQILGLIALAFAVFAFCYLLSRLSKSGFCKNGDYRRLTYLNRSSNVVFLLFNHLFAKHFVEVKQLVKT